MILQHFVVTLHPISSYFHCGEGGHSPLPFDREATRYLLLHTSRLSEHLFVLSPLFDCMHDLLSHYPNFALTLQKYNFFNDNNNENGNFWGEWDLTFLLEMKKLAKLL